MADAHANFAYSTVATAPSPPTSGESLVVASGDGAKFPTPPFNATVWPAGVQPTTGAGGNAEIVRVTGVSTDTFTMTGGRAAEGTTARSIAIGYQIAATITALTLTDAEGPNQIRPVGNTTGTTAAWGTGSFGLAGGNNITLSQSSGTNSTNITIHGLNPIYTYQPYYPHTGSSAMSIGSSTSAPLFLFPFQVVEPVAAGWVNLLYSLSYATFTSGSSAAQTWTNSMGLYTRQSGANSTRLSRLFQTSFSMAATHTSGSICISYPTTTYNTNYSYGTSSSAGVGMSSAYTGMKLIQYGINSTITPGWYYLAAMNLSSTVGQSNAIISQNNLVVISEQAALRSIGVLGSYSSAFSSGTNVGSLPGGGNWMQMMGSYVSAANQAAFPAEITISQITQDITQVAIMQFFSTS